MYTISRQKKGISFQILARKGDSKSPPRPPTRAHWLLCFLLKICSMVTCLTSVAGLELTPENPTISLFVNGPFANSSARLYTEPTAVPPSPRLCYRATVCMYVCMYRFSVSEKHGQSLCFRSLPKSMGCAMLEGFLYT